MAVGTVGELLAEHVGAVAGEEGCDGRLGLGVGAFLVFEVRGLVTVGPVVDKGGVGTEAVGVDVEVDRLGELALARHSGVAHHAHQLLCGLVGDDVDDAGDGIAAVERRGCSVEHLDALHACHVDAVEVNIVRDVARQFLSVHQNEDVLVAQSVEPQEGAHRVGCHRHLGHHACEDSVEGGDALFADFLRGKHTDGRGCVLHALMVARACDDDGVEVVGVCHGRRVGTFHLVNLRKGSTPRKECRHQKTYFLK